MFCSPPAARIDPMSHLDAGTSIPKDIWTETDFPVLRALAAWYTNDEHSSFISTEDVRGALGWAQGDEERVGYAVDRLEDARLIEVLNALDGKPYPSLVHKVTTAGLRASGAYPSEASILTALEDALADLADRQEAANPEEASKLRAAAGVVGRMAVSVGTDFASRFVAHAAGLP
jgi:hypothetical protein